ncbi:MAG TPA: flagellar filament capping protein FliD [Edaphobacter sp.]|nr:flagellar filament capping protein FliD [Edaphobacter sp.]
MGTVGINFGSVNSGTGFDVAATVTSILAIQQSIETPWKTQLANLQAQDTAFSSMGKDLAALATSLQSLTDFNGVLASKEGSSSDTNVLALTSASPSAVAGSHTIIVNTLAQTSSNFSNRITNATDTLSGSLSIQIGSSTKSITLDSTNNTLAGLAMAINSSSMGVTASVVKDTQGSRLSIVSSASGAAGQMTLTSSLTDSTTGAAMSFQVGQPGVDATLSVDGLDMTSASNTVTGAIPGVTFQLLSKSPSSSVQVQITNDNTTVETAVNAFATAYNAVISDIQAQQGKDANGNAQPLYGDPTLAMIQNQLTMGLLGGGTSGKINSITQLGISLDKFGKLSLDTSALDSALNANYADITGFLQNSGSFGQTFTATLNGLSSTSTKGAIYLATQQNTAQEAALTKSISDQDARIADDRVRLTTELNTANQILQSIPDQVNQINQMYSAVTGYNAAQG